MIPPLLTSPPGLETLSGNLDPKFESTLGITDPRDFVVFTRKSSEGKFSTWSSTVATQSRTFSLNAGAVRTASLEEPFGSTGDIELIMNGELNSLLTQMVSDIEEVLVLEPQTGLSVSSTLHGETVSNLEVLKGTVSPGGSVQVTFAGASGATAQAQANADGEWEVSLSGLSAGDYNVKISDSGEVLGMSIEVVVDILPDTALKDLLPLIIGVFLISLGIGSVYVTRSDRKKL
jgi:hypothetical protein